MNISSSYYNDWYSLYYSQLNSTQQINVNQSKTSNETDSTLQLTGMSGISLQDTPENKPTSPLADLVSSGIITSDQEQAIKDAFETSRMVYQTQAGAANASGTFKNPLENLVSSGTISEEQATAVKDALDSAKGMQRMPPPPPPSRSSNEDSMESILESLVETGEITSEQEETILEALQANVQSNQTQSEEESDPLYSLVTDGTITGDQKSAVISAFESAIKAYMTQNYTMSQSYGSNFDEGF